MSHAVKIDYRGISLECQGICNLASSQLCKLDKMLDEIEAGSKKLLNSHTDALRREISKTKKKLQTKIDSVVNAARANESRGSVIVDSDFMGKHANADNVIRQAHELESMVAELSERKMLEMETLLNSIMNDKLVSHQEKLRDLALGKTHINIRTQEKINAMSDEVMQQYVYMAWVDDQEAEYEVLLKKAEQLKQQAETKHSEQIEQKKLDEIRTELRAAKVDESTIESIVTQDSVSAKERIQNARKQANSELVNESVRRESIRIIISEIKKQGFVIDQRAIRIDKSQNMVSIVAQKPDGARAEFKVYLNGKFEYRFDGYEGQAYQKDIVPFRNALEKVYGIKILQETEIWRNPDKEMNMYYQAMNYSTNRE